MPNEAVSPTTIVVAESTGHGPPIGSLTGPVVWIVGGREDPPDLLARRVLRRVGDVDRSSRVAAAWFGLGSDAIEGAVRDARRTIAERLLRALARGAGTRLDLHHAPTATSPFDASPWELMAAITPLARDGGLTVVLHRDGLRTWRGWGGPLRVRPVVRRCAS